MILKAVYLIGWKTCLNTRKNIWKKLLRIGCLQGQMTNAKNSHFDLYKVSWKLSWENALRKMDTIINKSNTVFLAFGIWNLCIDTTLKNTATSVQNMNFLQKCGQHNDLGFNYRKNPLLSKPLLAWPVAGRHCNNQYCAHCTVVYYWPYSVRSSPWGKSWLVLIS